MKVNDGVIVLLIVVLLFCMGCMYSTWGHVFSKGSIEATHAHSLPFLLIMFISFISWLILPMTGLMLIYMFIYGVLTKKINLFKS